MKILLLFLCAPLTCFLFTSCSTKSFEFPDISSFELVAETSTETLNVGDTLNVSIILKNSLNKNYDIIHNGNVIIVRFKKSGEIYTENDNAVTDKLIHKKSIERNIEFMAEKGEFSLSIHCHFMIINKKSNEYKEYHIELPDKNYNIK